MPYARRRRLKRARQARTADLDPKRPLELVRIPPEDVTLVWPLCQDYIEEGAYYGEISPLRIYQLCLRDHLQLWLAWSDGKCEGAGITMLLNCPEGLVCQLACMSCDDFERCRREIAPQWEVWAKERGCVSMRINGRPGWERLMRADYTKRWVVIDKRL